MELSASVAGMVCRPTAEDRTINGLQLVGLPSTDTQTRAYIRSSRMMARKPQGYHALSRAGSCFPCHLSTYQKKKKVPASQQRHRHSSLEASRKMYLMPPVW